ncbi:VWA-like domain-containing protein [Porphyromonas sp. HMSC065F10]|uniref:VWA-like domain-containing protein n=1 Tax=Porphyromonas sp. HMSC065F10 TaxID=1739394 RepID=UPI0008BAAB8E|nr:VWA-like domain-containing protein [Porphyromonas sp. HMSC065F10]OFR37731.1 hypothetical protein HMPREF2890_03490 [Porphyromonas sp. HMSC065F10]
MMASPSDRFKQLAEHWFLTEPAFFAIYCSHALTMNPRINCYMRIGKGRLEYNPGWLRELSDAAFEEVVRIEMLRAFLKHPYERQPTGATRKNMYSASDMVLTSHYKFRIIQLKKPSLYHLPSKMHYEWYLAHIPPKHLGGNSDPSDIPGDTPDQDSEQAQGQASPDDASDGMQVQEDQEMSNEDNTSPNLDDEVQNTESPSQGLDGADEDDSRQPDYGEAAELWEEDESRQLEINELIMQIKDWGSISGGMVEQIMASTQAKIDYRKALAGFRASVISSKRTLTRMRPSRRWGFEQMGSKYAFSTSLLIAVDTSGSISTEMLKHFFSVIVKFFKYGIEQIDVIQFDCVIQGECKSLKKAKKQNRFAVHGRGGTSFQPVFDYLHEHNRYDGLIILTDGYAEVPHKDFSTRARILWVCESEDCYNQHKQWMSQLGRCCYMNLK